MTENFARMLMLRGIDQMRDDLSHRIPMPTRLAPPTCSCGWSAPLPWRCTWDQWHTDAEAHLAQYVDCAAHGVQHLTAEGRCGLCRNQNRRPQPEETR